MNKITITETDGRYALEIAGSVSDFALIGILECALFDLKNRRAAAPLNSELLVDAPETAALAQPSAAETAPAAPKTDAPITDDAKIPAAAAPDVRTRIANALKAIKLLGGQVDPIDLETASEEDLQTELEALTEQYKRLKAKGK